MSLNRADVLIEHCSSSTLQLNILYFQIYGWQLTVR